MRRQTEANQFIVFDVVRDLIIEHSPLSIIEGVLLLLVQDTSVLATVIVLLIACAILQWDERLHWGSHFLK